MVINKANTMRGRFFRVHKYVLLVNESYATLDRSQVTSLLKCEAKHYNMMCQAISTFTPKKEIHRLYKLQLKTNGKNKEWFTTLRLYECASTKTSAFRFT